MIANHVQSPTQFRASPSQFPIGSTMLVMGTGPTSHWCLSVGASPFISSRRMLRHLCPPYDTIYWYSLSLSTLAGESAAEDTSGVLPSSITRSLDRSCLAGCQEQESETPYRRLVDRRRGSRFVSCGFHYSLLVPSYFSSGYIRNSGRMTATFRRMTKSIGSFRRR